MTHRLFRLASGLALVALCVAERPSAQEPAAPQAPAQPPAPQVPAPPVFRGGIDTVSVDVIVTDRQGRPVTDLTPQDFEVREEGKPQAIETFKLVKVDDDRETPVATRDILSPADQDRELSRDDNRILVIFLDDYHTRLGNSILIRERLAQFVSQLAPHDLVALTTPLRPASALTFSRNHDATASQLMNFKGRKYDYRPMHPLEEQYMLEPPAVQERRRNNWTIASIRALCEYMASLRAGRKTVLYVSEGMSNTLPSGVLTSGTMGMPNAPLTGPPPTPDPMSRESSQQLLDSMELITHLQDRVFTVAARTNTSIYTIDPRGLAVSEFGVADQVSTALDRAILGQTTDVLRTIADATDGRAIVSRNDPLPALQQMLRDGSAYYLIGYNSSSAFRDGKFHEIQVRVKRKDVDVRARKGYWAITADEVARASAAAKPPLAPEVATALNTLATVAESRRRQPVSLWTGATRGPSEKAIVTFVWEATSSPDQSPSEQVDRVSITARAASGETLFAGPVTRDPQATGAAGQIAFEAPAGTVRLQVNLENASGRRLETSDLTVDVPDFSSTGGQISTPVVYRGRTARDLQQVRVAGAATMPTTVRAFSRAERLLLRFDAFGPGGVPPTVTMKVLNQSGSPVASMPAPTRTADNRFESEFSLSAFPPADYLIEIAADINGQPVKRLVAIRVLGS